MSVILRDRARWSVLSLPVGRALVLRDYACDECPACGASAAWVGGELCCIECGRRHVRRVGRSDAFDQVLQGAARGRQWRQ